MGKYEELAEQITLTAERLAETKQAWHDAVSHSNSERARLAFEVSRCRVLYEEAKKDNEVAQKAMRKHHDTGTEGLEVIDPKDLM